MSASTTAVEVMSAIFQGQDGSMHVHTGQVPQSGYMVGGASWTLTIQADEIDCDVIDLFINAHREAFEDPNTYIGWWEHDGRIYLDVSDNLQRREWAIALGKARHELAVFDLTAMEEIPCR